MKQRTKVMLSSLAAIAMSASLAVGATYALFTSETQVDISVSSGSVNVDATAKNLELYSKGLKQDGGTFEVGGTATLVENVITIERMVPMDSVKFDIVIENYSDVSVQYRTIVKELEDTGLFPALKVSFTGRETNKAEFEGASSYSDWALVAPQDTDPTTAEHIQTVGVTIDFPHVDGVDQNKYQNTSCKLVVIVEAVQANADVHSGVAKIGDTAYETLEEALAMAQPNDVVEMLHPGVYAPFTVNTQGVTVKGIVGENKLESTVFQVTGDNMINLMASGTTIDGLWIEVVGGGGDWTSGAFNIVQSWATGTVSDDVTITNSKIYGNDKLNFVLLCCNDTFTFTNNYVDGFPTAVSSMCDNSVAVLYTITGNTTNNVTSLLDGYWGAENTTGGTNIVVNNNVANDETLIRLWDFAYNVAGTAVNAEVKDNTNAKVMLTRGKAGATVATDETVLYQNVVKLTGFAEGTYTAVNMNGNAPAYNDNVNVKVDANGEGTIRLTAGTYQIVNENDVSYQIVVAQDTFAIDANGLAYYVTNNAQLLAAITNEGEKTTKTAATIYLAAGTYSADLNLTTDEASAPPRKQTGDLTFVGLDRENVVLTGTTVLGYRHQTVGATMWKANVTFNNLTFDHALDANHSINVGDVKSINLINCTLIGDGEFGIVSQRGNATGVSLIQGCTFENAAMQILGNFGKGLVIDGCTFNNSRVNVQAGNGVTVQNCTFNATLTDANVDESFYLVRGSANGGGIPVTIKNCKMNIDSTVTGIAASQASWGAIWNRGATIAWTLENVEITVTEAAKAQTELKIIKTAGGAMNMTNVTLNGVQQ